MLRNQATVYLIDPAKGYQLSRQGTSGVTCLVELTAWELADFRDDIYISLCYDAVGTKTYLQVIKDTATLRSHCVSPAAFKAQSPTRNELSDFSHLWLVGVVRNDGATRCRGLKSLASSICGTGYAMQAIRRMKNGH